MSKKNNEVKENEELKEEVVTETTEEVKEEAKETNTTETTKEVKEEAKETNTTETTEEVKEEKTTKKSSKDKLVANTSFNDKYTGTTYEKGDEFIINKKYESKKAKEIKAHQYEISEARAEELRKSKFVD